MTTHIQPSSPISASVFAKDNPTSYGESTFIGAVNNKHAPTPLPTSSPGSKNGFSTTVMESEDHNLESSKILNPEDEFGMPPVFDIKSHTQIEEGGDYNLSSGDMSSQQLNSHAIDPQEQSDEPVPINSDIYNDIRSNSLQVLTLPIMSHEQSKTVTIGRSSKMNDFQLTPKSGLISRQHLALTYFPNSNSLRIKCYGKNGVVVNFPKELQYKLVRQLKEKIFELVPKDDAAEFVNDKEIVSNKGITSFVLNEREICFIPYMTGLQLSFGVVSVEVVIKDMLSDTEELGEAAAQSSNRNQERNGSAGSNILSSPLADVVEYDEQDKPDMTHENLQAKLLAEEDSANKPDKKIITVKRSLEETSQSVNDFKKQKTSLKNNFMVTKRQALEQLMNKLSSLNISIKELVHLLTNHIAFAPVQQIPLRQLYEANTSTSNHLSLPEFKIFTENLLLNMEPSIQMIPRQGKDAAGKLLDPEFFYDVEKDNNEERVLIVGSLKGGRSGLRNCRKTHKQYFWKKPTK
ncbi:hypothetical protein QEN19_002965 [Hanseniaspora menglaensis]